MKTPEIDLIKRIDALTQSHYSFAMYRLPWTDECNFVLQTEGEAEKPEDIGHLNGKKGFVIAPFHPSETAPLVIIRPDETALGWDEIDKVTLSLKKSDALCPAKRHFTESSPTDAYEVYQEVFGRFIRPLQKKEFEKLVLSRTDTQPIAEDFSPLGTFIKACNNYPRMMIYLCHTPSSGTWIGSTPEILLSGQGKEWHTVALAGTMPMQGEVMPENWSQKNRDEQALVTEYIRRIVKKFGSKVDEKGPYTARAGQLVHLKTDFRFQLKNTKALGNLLDKLHPTPAVCGLPKEEAYWFIHENESHERSYYSGFIGWLDPEGQTDIYVNLRCMEIHANAVTLYAGGGILASSEAASEWEETNEKMKTMRNII